MRHVIKSNLFTLCKNKPIALGGGHKLDALDWGETYEVFRETKRGMAFLILNGEKFYISNSLLRSHFNTKRK